jgi:hypothetical protein
LVNAQDEPQAEAALDRRLVEKGLAGPRQTAAMVISAVRTAYPELNPFWATGIGTVLMNIDAYMCLCVIEKLMDAGIVVLTVHDSFVVPAQHEAMLAKAMEAAFELGLREAARRLGPRARASGLCGNGLTYGSPSVPPSRPRPSFRQVLADRAVRMLAELESLLIADPRPLTTRMRLAAILVGSIYPLANDLAARTSALFARCSANTDTEAMQKQLRGVVAEIEGRGHFRISTAGAARLAVASQDLADDLGLELLKPAATHQLSRAQRNNLRRRLRRQGKRTPQRIVKLGLARPWELEGIARSTWYARHRSRREHQMLGLQALMLRGDAAAIADVQREIALRTQSSQSHFLRDMQRLLDTPA